MEKAVENHKPENAHASDHMANERTYLAWIRTAMGIMAFGFVVERFALFINRINLLVGKESFQTSPSLLHGHSSLLGLFIVAIGILLALFSFINFRNVQKQINDESYHPSNVLNIILIFSILLIGGFLILYLLPNVTYSPLTSE